MKPVLTEQGKLIVKDFIAHLEELRKDVTEIGQDRVGDTEIPTEEDILQDILLFEEDFEEGRYYPATESFGLWLALKFDEEYYWEYEDGESEDVGYEDWP